ncbi:MAG: alpha/beta fold hydrolase [Gammaproteobacteria bacterium]|nr:alpha/beta fold hydrolase [Gammaproteobacteria bacterium]
MDGTGEHFAQLLAALGDRFPTIVVRYPDEPLDYEQHERIARAALPQDRPYVLLGESFSGPIALAIAADAPAGLVGYILCASFARCPRWILRLASPFLGLVPFRRIPNSLVNHFLIGRFATPDLRLANAAPLHRVSPATLSARLQAIAKVDVTEKLARIRVPGLYLRGTQDRLIPASACRALRRAIPGLRRVEIQAPHFVLQVNPRLAAEAIAQFIGTICLDAATSQHHCAPGQPNEALVTS